MSAVSIFVTTRDNIAGIVTLEKQIDFALRKSLNDAVILSQKQVVQNLRRTYTIRGSWIDQTNRYGVKVKLTRQRGQYKVALYSLADWLEDHETGATRRSQSGNRLSLPYVGSGARPTRPSVIVKRLKPKFILPPDANNRDVQRNGKRKYARQRGTAFKIDGQGGKSYVARRNAGKLEFLWSLNPDWKFPKQPIFWDTAKLIFVTARFFDIFRRNLENAILTARP